MTKPLQIGHRRTLLQGSAFVGHWLKAGEINHEAHEGHEEFAREGDRSGCHTIVTWQ
ncbi:MAG TPA: hypothetical protein VNN24_04535 [Candidatus Binatus sp.]|nr:hypothetical protein [Candidatus Binatus sp.]